MDEIIVTATKENMPARKIAARSRFSLVLSWIPPARKASPIILAACRV